MSDVTMIATMLKRWTLTFRPTHKQGEYRLDVHDARLDTTAVYESHGGGIGHLITQAFEDYALEYL